MTLPLGNLAQGIKPTFLFTVFLLLMQNISVSLIKAAFLSDLRLLASKNWLLQLERPPSS